MKQIIINILLMFVFANVFSQTNEKSEFKHGFDMQKFDDLSEKTDWLIEYDIIAWWTSDSVMQEPKEEIEKLGSEWFCYKIENKWHALYGKTINDKFETVFHYTVDTDNIVKKSDEIIDTSITNSFGRALARTKIDTIIQENVRHNTYAKINESGNIEIFILPAFQTDGTAVWGSDFWFKYDKLGIKLLDKNINYRKYWGAKPDINKELMIDYSDYETPPIGAVFFAWYYKRYFKKIIIKRKFGRSVPFYNENNGDGFWNWVHFDDRK